MRNWNRLPSLPGIEGPQHQRVTLDVLDHRVDLLGRRRVDQLLELQGVDARVLRLFDWRNTQPLANIQTIKFTGGTTSRPKGVLQTYRVVNTSIASYLHHFRFDAADVNLAAAPLTHGSSHYILPILSVGGRHVLVREPKAPALLDAFERRGCTTAFMPPTMIYALMAEQARSPRRLDAVRHLQYGAAPMPPERIRAALGVFGGSLDVVYGQTEAPMMITCATGAELARDETIAALVANKVLE